MFSSFCLIKSSRISRSVFAGVALYFSLNSFVACLYLPLFSVFSFVCFSSTISCFTFSLGVNVSKEDHILTLSTCGPTSATRLVIHAVLVDE